MINIQENKNCCGCSACASICPKHCIKMVEDNEGFLYPHVDNKLCVNCGLCEKVCNELQPYDKREPLHVFAAINNNEEVRLKSSSGGIFYVLAEKTIHEGGVVFGARFDDNWKVVIDYAEDMKSVEAFMGSKYLQARIDNAYKDVKRFLNDGRKVLFSGTPCQVAGLHKFLRKPYDDLLTVDFICHGTPSPKVWGMYLDEVIKEGKRLSKVEFRNKKKGWKNFSFNISYNEADQMHYMSSPFTKDLYMNVFLKNVILRPSCYDCKAHSGRSQSDITLADFWGINTVFPEMDDDRGTSMVFINTKKGCLLFGVDGIRYKETTYETIKHLNPACYSSPHLNPKREYFFKNIDLLNTIDLMKECIKPTREERIIMFQRSIKNFLKKPQIRNPTKVSERCGPNRQECDFSSLD